jgi:Tfp pilus assembly major pilin PilA
MKRSFKKLSSDQGESLLETLVAIMIIAVTSTILLMYIRSAAAINNQATDAFALFSSEMIRAESRVPEGTSTVIMNGVSIDVHYSGSISDEAIHAYWRAP